MKLGLKVNFVDEQSSIVISIIDCIIIVENERYEENELDYWDEDEVKKHVYLVLVLGKVDEIITMVDVVILIEINFMVVYLILLLNKVVDEIDV